MFPASTRHLLTSELAAYENDILSSDNPRKQITWKRVLKYLRHVSHVSLILSNCKRCEFYDAMQICTLVRLRARSATREHRNIFPEKRLQQPVPLSGRFSPVFQNFAMPHQTTLDHTLAFPKVLWPASLALPLSLRAAERISDALAVFSSTTTTC